jgi:hypothetical protein
MPENYTGIVDLEIESEKACPTFVNAPGQQNSTGSIVGGFITSFTILTAIYFVLGTAYNMSVNQSKILLY